MSPRLQFRRHWKRWVIGSVLVVAVLVVGGPFVYIHFIEGSAPSKFHLPASSATRTGAAPATSLDGSWKVSSGAQAGYRVQEILFGQSHTAVGRTTGVTGQLTVAQNQVTAANVVVDLTKVTSDSGQRDNQFQGRIMDTASFPTATFTLTTPIPLSTVPANGKILNVSATGNLTLRGATHPVVASLQAERNGTSIQVSGSIPVTFSTWNIPNPSFGPASTGDSGVVEFLLTFTHA